MRERRRVRRFRFRSQQRSNSEGTAQHLLVDFDVAPPLDSVLLVHQAVRRPVPATRKATAASTPVAQTKGSADGYHCRIPLYRSVTARSALCAAAHTDHSAALSADPSGYATQQYSRLQHLYSYIGRALTDAVGDQANVSSSTVPASRGRQDSVPRLSQCALYRPHERTEPHRTAPPRSDGTLCILTPFRRWPTRTDRRALRVVEPLGRSRPLFGNAFQHNRPLPLDTIMEELAWIKVGLCSQVNTCYCSTLRCVAPCNAVLQHAERRGRPSLQPLCCALYSCPLSVPSLHSSVSTDYSEWAAPLAVALGTALHWPSPVGS